MVKTGKMQRKPGGGAGLQATAHELEQFLRWEVEEQFFESAGEEFIGHIALAGEHGVDVFLDGAAADEGVNDDRVHCSSCWAASSSACGRGRCLLRGI